MSNAIQVIEADIYGTRDSFQAVLADRSVNFDREASFAVQVLTSNDYALGLAMKNRQSVVNAVTNLAAIGLSLNPAKKQAYLVPRDGKICLDISYIGLVELAVASGSVRWVKAELVREADEFALRGMDQLPVHKFNPFSKDRGAITGVYCVAKTADGDYLTEVMSIDEVYAIRDRSSAWKAWVEKKKKCPWVTDEGEMVRKTCTKRASKYWPKTDRLDQAIHHLNTDGDEGLAETVEQAQEVATFNADAWIAKANGAATIEALESVWRQGAKAAADAKDKHGHAKFKQAVIERKANLEAVNV